MSANGFIQHATPYTPPFIEQGDGITPALGNDLKVCPYLPAKRSSQLWQGNFGNFDVPVVIEAGEPVGVWEDTSGNKWLVPASPVPYQITYAAGDVGNTEDLDVPGTAVAASGDSTAYIGATLPIGLAHQPIIRNSYLSTGEIVNENFDPAWKAVVMRRRHFMIPYFRNGANAIGHVNEGDLCMNLGITGSKLSASSRPRLGPCRIDNEDTTTEPSASTRVITPTFADVATGDSFTITIQGCAVTFTVVAAAKTSVGYNGYFVKGVAVANTITNFIAAWALTALKYRGTPTSTDTATTITITATELGAVAIGYAEVSDEGDAWAAAGTSAGTAASGGMTAGLTVNALHLGNIIGRFLRVWEQGVPDTFDLSKAVTPRDSGLAGTGTNGVAQELAFAGNTFEGAVAPSAYTEAGALLIAFEL